MPELISNTSPLLYLHQLGLLEVFPRLAGRVVVPTAVVDELREGHTLGYDTPAVERLGWAEIRQPLSAAVLPLVRDLGRGETQVIALALESPGATVVLDDALARRVAIALNVGLTGTLGLLLDAKKAGVIEAVKPALDRLHALRFRVAPPTRAAVLALAGEVE